MITRAALLCLASLVAAAPAAADTFKFAWNPPAAVRITERVTKRGVPATMRYTAALTPASDGEHLALTLRDFEFLDFGGMNPKNKALRKQIDSALRLAGAMPTILISKQGAYTGITDLDAMIERAVAVAKLSAKPRKEFEALLRSPMTVATMEQRASEFWNLWVGLWVGQKMVPGRPVQLKRAPTASADSLDVPVTLAHNGIGGPPGHVRLSFDSRLDGQNASSALERWLAGVLAQVQQATGKKVPREDVEGARLSLSGEVLTDPDTLRPAAARSAREVALKLKGQPGQTDVELHEYTFDWSAPAPPAGKPAAGK